MIEAYRENHPELTIELESERSGTGFAASLASECDIASSSRVINEDETCLATARGIKLNSYAIG